MKSNTIILIALTVIIAGVAYWYFATKTGNDVPVTASTTTAPSTQFQGLLSELRSISFDTTIFSDTRFISLVDLTVPVTSEPPGRLDPFAPVTGSVASTSNVLP
jgi:hypothetical protein